MVQALLTLALGVEVFIAFVVISLKSVLLAVTALPTLVFIRMPLFAHQTPFALLIMMRLLFMPTAIAPESMTLKAAFLISQIRTTPVIF
jgi:hypothetical protein